MNTLKKIIVTTICIIIFIFLLIKTLNKQEKIKETFNNIKNQYEILVDIEESKLYLFNNKRLEKIYECSG